jgi:hypothetical protein
MTFTGWQNIGRTIGFIASVERTVSGLSDPALTAQLALKFVPVRSRHLEIPMLPDDWMPSMDLGLSVNELTQPKFDREVIELTRFDRYLAWGYGPRSHIFAFREDDCCL